MLPVLIAGAGPVGLALAGDLGWRGVPCLVIDQGDGSVDQPRMDMVSARSMEFCRRWGIEEQVRAADYPQDRGQDFVYVDYLAGIEFGRECMPPRRANAPAPWSPTNRDRCPQHLFDPILRRFACAQPGVQLRYGVRLAGFEQFPDHVLAVLEDVASGAREQVTARYLAGCDGAGSTVRRQLDISTAGSGMLTRSVSIMFRAPGLEARAGKGENYRYLLFGAEGPWASMVAITGYDEWRLQVIDGGAARWGEAEAHAAIHRALGFKLPYELLSINNWARVEQVAERYGEGRAFLVGDAAHTLSPTGGFGMNTGIGEAVDLGWKLAAVLAGWGGPRLLASYEGERRPIAIINARTASENLQRMCALRPPPEAFHDPQAARGWGEVVSATMRKEWYSPHILVGYRYAGSPITEEDGEAPPPPVPWAQQCLVGGRAPHAWLAPGVSTLDWFGRGFVLLRCGASAEALAKAAQSRGMPWAEHELPAALLPLYGRRLTLVRPDGHVAWRGDAPPSDAGALLDRVRGA